MQKHKENHNRWIRSLRQSSAPRRHVICFPHAGGAASFFHPWALHLPMEVSLSAVQYPGREDRLSDEMINNMQNLVEQAVTAIRPICDDDTVLFGHSMGAAVAYEVTVRLREAGVPLSRLVVSAHPPPHRYQPKRAPSTEAEILEELRITSGQAALPFDLEIFREVFLPSLRNDYSLICSYTRPNPTTLDIPITAVVGRADPKVTPSLMDRWRELAPPNAFTTAHFDGGHFYFPDVVRDVIALISV